MAQWAEEERVDLNHPYCPQKGVDGKYPYESGNKRMLWQVLWDQLDKQ